MSVRLDTKSHEPSVIGVSMKPGAIAFSLMPAPIHSSEGA